MALRIAFLANYLPAPANSGSLIRSSRLALALARHGAVRLYCRGALGDGSRLAGHADLAPFARVQIRENPPELHARLARIFTSEAIDDWTSAADPLAAVLARDHEIEPFDVIVCQSIFAANIARLLPEVPLVLDEHNIESAALATVLASYPRSQAEEISKLAARLKDYEREVWSGAALVTCTTEPDAAQIRSRCRTRVLVVPNGADVDQIRFLPPSGRCGKEILFVGAFFWPPNFKAARFLVKEVLPRVRSEEPEARLVLCGKSPGIEVALLRREGVEVTGTVDSVAPYLERATVYANALFEGTGSSLKVLEALASGVPLVSTTTGVRGHPLVAGRHYLDAEDAAGFARAILATIADPKTSESARRAHDGRLLAESFAWERVGAAFAQAVADVVQGCAERPGSGSAGP